MTFTQVFQALDQRGIDEALFRSGEPMRLRIDGEWRAQGTPAPLGTLAALVESALPPDQRASWEAQGRCQFPLDGYSIKAARDGERVQIAVKRQTPTSQSPFAAGATSADATAIAPVTVTAPVVTAPVVTAPAIAPTQTTVSAPKPSVPLAGAQWYYLDGDEQKGPFAADRFRTLISMGTLGADTVVWRDGMGDWAALSQTELAPALPKTTAVVAPIAAPTATATPRSRSYNQMIELPNNLDSFNWGAFLLPTLWCLFNNQSSRAWPIFLVRLIPIVGGLISLFLAAQLAAEANQLAWAARHWTAPREFETVQKRWLIAGIVVTLFPFLVAMGIVALGSTR